MNRISICFVLLAGSVIAGFCFSMLSWSSFPLSRVHLWGYLTAFDSNNMEQQILATLRAPRVYASMLIGANLAIAGVLMQGLTRNPLASPSVLGINAGAACGMALASIGFLSLDSIPNVVVASAGGIASGVLVMLLGGFFSPRPHPLKLVLAGIAVNALLIGMTRASVILADDMAYSVIYWLSGSVSNIEWQQWHQLWPVSLVGIAISIAIARHLNLIALGDDVAIGLGLNVAFTRLCACVAIVLLTGVSVSVAGPIGFVGLIVPHVMRQLVGNNALLLIPASGLGGALLMVWADGLSRGIAFPAETAVGVITALIGTPCFILLAVRSRL